MDCSTPGFPVHHQLPEFIQTHVHWSVMPFNHLILCHPLLLPSIFPSIREQTSNYQTSPLFLVMLYITLLPVETSILFSFLSSGWHIYFYLPCLWTPHIFGGFCTYKSKFVFLLLICLMSIWLLDQPREPVKNKGKFLLPTKAKWNNFPSLFSFALMQPILLEFDSSNRISLTRIFTSERITCQRAENSQSWHLNKPSLDGLSTDSLLASWSSSHPVSPKHLLLCEPSQALPSSAQLGKCFLTLAANRKHAVCMPWCCRCVQVLLSNS